MIPKLRSRTGAAALVGAAFGASLTAAEAAAMLLPGGEPILRAWIVVALESSLACAAVAAALFAIAHRVSPAVAAARPHLGALTAASCLLAPASVLGTALLAGRGPAPRVRDLPQPDPGPHAAWLAGKPNVVLIVLDTVRADSLSAYGYARRTTPRLDALAAESVRFASASTVGDWSVPAHASLFTGLYPLQHGAGLDPDQRLAPLADEFETLAETLAARGYATGGIAANVILGDDFNLGQGFRFYDARPARALRRYRPLLARMEGRLPAPLRPGPLLIETTPAWRPAERITDAAIHWLDARRDPGQPYFLFVNYMDAHSPYAPPARFRDLWPGRSPRLPAYGLRRADAIRTGDGGSASRASPDEQRQHIRALYDASLSYLDEQVGRLLGALRGRPDGANTWIVVTSDHGEMLGEHDVVGHHCDFYEAVLRVPLIVRAPGGGGRGRVDERPVQTVDVAPMILAGVGLASPAAPAPDGAREDALVVAGCPCDAPAPRPHSERTSVLTWDGLKLIEHDGRARLFDLRGDPGETRDVAAERPHDAQRLRARLHERLAALGRPLPAARADAGRLEALRALGYH